MSLLDKKLLRDLRSLKSQALAVALVMACGLAMMVMTRSLILSLDSARTAYYEVYRFGEVFARLKRAPLEVARRAAEIPGVAAVQPSIARMVTLDVPSLPEPATALINSVPERGEAVLNRLHLRAGRLLSPGSRGEILVSEAFSDAHHLKPGDRLSAILNGRKVALRIAGIVLSPEFVFEAPPGAALPDNRTFAVLWMNYEELAQAYSLDGAFNQLSLALQPGASVSAVIASLDRLLVPYGGLRAYGRIHHASNLRVNDEIRVLQGLAVGFPLVFLAVGAFMTHAVMSRQITLQREQIAMLKACGFGAREIGGHYLKFALVIVGVGAVLGVIGGVVLGHRLVDLYHRFFRFPDLHFQLASGALIVAVIASALAAMVGVWGAVRRAMRLAPAEAMRPEPPARFSASLVERAGLGHWFSASMRMAFRNLERKPVQAFLTSAALALATAILIIPNAFRDGISYVLDFQWDIVQRQTVSMGLVEPGPARALADFRHLPGVVSAEPFRATPVELRSGPRARRLSIIGLAPHGQLNRVVDADLRQMVLPPQGLVLSSKLGQVLGVRVGDALWVRSLEGRRVEKSVPVAGFSEDFAGVSAFMDLGALNRLLLEGDVISGAYLAVDRSRWAEFLAAVKETPRAASVVVKDAMRESFRKTTAESIGVLQTMYLTFATLVAFGIVYNSARISLSERARELATLRVLGFTRGEVGAVLVGELSVLALVAVPVGLWLGGKLAGILLLSINTETVRLPLVLTAANYSFAASVITVATTLSLLLAARRIKELDLVGVLKVRD
ncbi:MAG TPA: FtsX-like permease family protein [Opitutaceae bacterium]|nr:FtsX-like permease family protein [Opitutaceae bacterium]